MLTIDEVILDFALAFKQVDALRPIGRSKTREYKPGIGPLTENEAVTRALRWLQETKPKTYAAAGPKAYPGSRQACDLVIPEELAIECKLIRPFGDNGIEAEHWSENILHPYPGNVSAVGDALKLSSSGFRERKGILIFGYEHLPARVNLDIAVRCFELICDQIVGIRLSKRAAEKFPDLIHPCHQLGKVYGWELV